MKKSSLVLACLLLTGACSKVKELDKRTENLEKSTEKMSSTTENMGTTMDVQYQQLRSGDTAALRLNTFTHMMDPKVGIGNKIADACIYFKAMEYQLWSDSEFDDEYMREKLHEDAVSEFTKRLSDIYAHIDIKKMSPTVEGKRHNDELAFYAFAVSLHMNHHFQDILTMKKSKLQEESMYDIIKKALAKNANRKLLLQHEEELVNGPNKDMMIDLLKARVDILSALALKNLTRKGDMNITQKAKGAIFKITGGRLGSIDLPEVYSTDDETTNNKTELYLDAAVSTKNFLRSIGVGKQPEKTLKSAFKNIDFNEKKSKDAEESAEAEQSNKAVDKKQQAIKNLIDQLLE